ncbi:MAG TPA: methyltransferase domain-containing protein [bacterium]
MAGETAAEIEAGFHPLRYETPQRLASYHYQIQAAMPELADASLIVHVGTGAGFIPWYAGRLGCRGRFLDVDIDPARSPEVLTSVTALGLATACADIAFCCQVLEHLPFSELDAALAELARVLRPGGKLILSLPHGGFYVQLEARLPKVRWAGRLPVPFLKTRRHPHDRKHQWEINRRGYSETRVRGMIARRFRIAREFRPRENPYHQFFVCRSRLPEAP